MKNSKAEWMTPPEYIEAARVVMGGIDLDPASSEKANKVVGAKTFYNEDGLKKGWHGRVWLFPPNEDRALWADTLAQHYSAGLVTEAILLVPTTPDTEWFHRLRFFPRVDVLRRTHFRCDETIPYRSRWGSTLFYLGPRPGTFYREFAKFGTPVQCVTEEEIEHLCAREAFNAARRPLQQTVG